MGTMNDDGTIIIQTTWPDAVEAEAAGRAIVADGLAASVNIMPGIVSIYRWQGEIERAEEVMMLFKTRAELAEPVTQAIRARHSFETPAILVLPVIGGDPDYLDWIDAETVLP